jgi:hypothetical protein
VAGRQCSERPVTRVVPRIECGTHVILIGRTVLALVPLKIGERRDNIYHIVVLITMGRFGRWPGARASDLHASVQGHVLSDLSGAGASDQRID